jgi:hypothetical protein
LCPIRTFTRSGFDTPIDFLQKKADHEKQTSTYSNICDADNDVRRLDEYFFQIINYLPPTGKEEIFVELRQVGISRDNRPILEFVIRRVILTETKQVNKKLRCTKLVTTIFTSQRWIVSNKSIHNFVHNVDTLNARFKASA